MTTFLMVIFLVVLFTISELVPLVKKKKWKELSIYTLILSIAVVLNVLILFNKNIPILSVSIKKLLSTFINFDT